MKSLHEVLRILKILDKPSRNTKDDRLTKFENYASSGNDHFIYYNAKSFIETLKKTPGMAESERVHYLFYDNVRGKLKSNIDMQNTIEKKANNFCGYNNNGISITGRVTVTDTNIIIENPSIVNGQQTVSNLIDSEHDIKNVTLPIFVKNVSDNVEKGDIALYNPILELKNCLI